MEFNSIQDFKSNYIQVYHKEVLPSIEKYEQERKKTKARGPNINNIKYIKDKKVLFSTKNNL